MTSLSDYWAGDLARALVGATDKTMRLALALGPVRSVIRVIDDSDPPMSVDWAHINENGRSISATNFDRNQIIINPLPVFDTDLTAQQQIDVCTGFGMHEASHAKESRDIWYEALLEDDLKTPKFEPLRRAANLLNLAEDIRIEAATSRKWPGFAPYFGAVLDWMWTTSVLPDMERGEVIRYGPKLEDKVRVVFLACRYPVQGLARVMEQDEPEDQEDATRAEFEWWGAWQAGYLDGSVPASETIRRGLEHLREDENTAKELDEMTAAEAAERERGEQIRMQLERLLNEGIPGMGVCITSEGEVIPVGAKEYEKISQLLREKLESVKPLFTDSNNQCAQMVVTKPEETAASRRAYVGKPTPLVDALRSALVFRQIGTRYDLKLRREGEIDDEELWRLAAGDERVFSERVIEGRPECLIGMLVDLSGSMEGPHLATAQRLAQTMLWALYGQDGVETQVWGHTGDVGDGGGSSVYRLWEPGDPMSRLGLISAFARTDGRRHGEPPASAASHREAS
jgi:hypothetical protein